MFTLILTACLAATTASQTITFEVVDPEVATQQQKDEEARTTQVIETETCNPESQVCSAEAV